MSNLRPVTLITGASAGIGVALAREFARHGHALALVARRADRLNLLADEIAATGAPRPIVIASDLALAGAVQAIGELLAASGAEPQYVVNNAGFGLVGVASSLDRAEQLAMIDLNMRLLTELSLAFVDSLQRHRGGLLNVGSMAGFLPGPGMAVYYATKAYVLSFTEALHSEFKPRGIKVTVLCPGPVPTEFAARAGVKGGLAPGLLTQTAEAVAAAGDAGPATSWSLWRFGCFRAGCCCASSIPARAAAARRKRLERGKVVGGARRDRTADLVIANDALSQLSYGPFQIHGQNPWATSWLPAVLGEWPPFRARYLACQGWACGDQAVFRRLGSIKLREPLFLKAASGYSSPWLPDGASDESFSLADYDDHRPLYLDPDRIRGAVLAGGLQRRQHPQSDRPLDRRFPLPGDRAGAAPDPQYHAQSRRHRRFAGDPDHRPVVPQAAGVLALYPDLHLVPMPARPWAQSGGGLTIAVRLTPKGGRDAIDGIETLSDGRAVLKVRVRAAPSEGEANDALCQLIAKSLGVPKRDVVLVAGATARIKRLAISGDGAMLAATLEKICASR
jgi:short-subunit dehydrogenase/uncharacterized protein YggU (UPF0235/DUF167 family)